MEKIREKTIDIIKQYAGDDIEITGNISLIEDLKFDSLQLVEVLDEIKKEFGVELDEDGKLLELVDNLEELIRYIEAKI